MKLFRAAAINRAQCATEDAIQAAKDRCPLNRPKTANILDDADGGAVLRVSLQILQTSPVSRLPQSAQARMRIATSSFHGRVAPLIRSLFCSRNNAARRAERGPSPGIRAIFLIRFSTALSIVRPADLKGKFMPGGQWQAAGDVLHPRSHLSSAFCLALFVARQIMSSEHQFQPDRLFLD